MVKADFSRNVAQNIASLKKRIYISLSIRDSREIIRTRYYGIGTADIVDGS